MIPVSIVVYWMMIFWLKQSDWKLKQSDTCVNSGLLNDDTLIKKSVNGGLLNDDTLIKTKWYMCQWWFIEMIQSDTCVNGGLLNDDILIKTKWYLCQWWFIEWWYFD